MQKKHNPIALITEATSACWVCQSKTNRIRSISHLNGAPTHRNDFVRICTECDDDWTFALTTDDPSQAVSRPDRHQ